MTGLLQALSEFPELELVLFEDPRNPLPSAIAPRAERVTIRSPRFSASGQFELREQCKREQVSLFHVPYQYGAPLFLTCPLVVTIHDLIPFLFRTRSLPKQFLALPLVKLGYYLAAVRAQHIIVDSNNTARDVEKILRVSPRKITSIHLAAAESLFTSRKDYGEAVALQSKYGVCQPYIVAASAGCNWRTKNLETALGALVLAERLCGIHFQTVVYGPEGGIKIAAKRGLTRGLNVRHVGYLPVCDLAALFRNAELFIMPSLYEGFGLPVLEAMSCGCPVITSNGGSLAEVAGQGALVFDPLDCRGMAEAIATLLRSPEERERWRVRASDRAAHFSWKKAAQQTLAVYRRVTPAECGGKLHFTYSHDV